ncbi:MAG: DUF1559 domain-containing protein, partial [Planctomycetaceae bacterium]|nr:DUF1559 domain-containing protein [Planctomycetaceae bacterium]
DWTDGTSNQFVITEKYIHPNNLGKCSFTSPGDQTADCSGYYQAFNDNRLGQSVFVANFSVGLVKRAEDVVAKFPGAETVHYGPGSYHPGICPFLKGDGSVSSVGNNTVNIVLMMLTDTHDGGNVTLP